MATDKKAAVAADDLDRPSLDVLAQRVKAALESDDIASFADLLDPAVRWGAPDDPSPSCQNRSQVLRWYEQGRAMGTRARVVGVETGADTILVELMVNDAANSSTEHPRWQVLRCRNGRVIDIRAFDDRADAIARM